jgi:malonyl-CoA O-methyltransferase
VINRALVRKAFDRRAHQYEDTVIVQKRIISKLLTSIAEAPSFMPAAVLDVGAGTGTLLRSMRNYFPEAFMVGIDLAASMGRRASHDRSQGRKVEFAVADAEQLPFVDDCIDLVLSTSTFQWLNSLDFAFLEARRVLRKGGVFRFAMFGGDTLTELRNSHRLAVAQSGRSSEEPSHSFFTPSQVHTALVNAGFSRCEVRSEIEIEYHKDVLSLLNALRSIGAGSIFHGRKGLAGKSAMERLCSIYRSEYGIGGFIPATYEVLYGYGVNGGYAGSPQVV